MKILIFILFTTVLSFASDVEHKPRLWYCGAVIDTPTARWFDYRIVEAKNLAEAKRLFNNYLKKQPCLTTGTLTLYGIEEFFPESDIIGRKNSTPPRATRDSYLPQGGDCK